MQRGARVSLGAPGPSHALGTLFCLLPLIRATKQAKEMAMQFKTDLDDFHNLVDGRLVAIHDMLNTIGMCSDAMCLCVRMCACAALPFREEAECCKALGTSSAIFALLVLAFLRHSFGTVTVLTTFHGLAMNAAMANSKPPLPPPAVAYLVELTEDQGKTQDSAGPQVTPDQLVSAFAKMIPPNDTKEVFEDRVSLSSPGQQSCLHLGTRQRG